jgi:hypothetical protein
MDAAANIRPSEAGELLEEFVDAEDTGTAEAAQELILTARGAGEEFDGEDDIPPFGKWVQ